MRPAILSVAVVILLSGSAVAGQANFDFKGVTYVSWQSGEYQLSDSDASLTDMRRTGANWVALLVTWYMPTATSTSIAATSDTPTDAAVIEAINDIHARGMKVLLKPHVDVLDGTWRGQISISSANKAAWFSSYTTFITHYAALAQTNNVEMLCMGTELKTMSGSTNLSFWTPVVTAIRNAYSGPLVYAANAYAPGDEYSTCCFWSQLDYAGANCYTPLTSKTNPTISDLKAGWSSNPSGWNMVSTLRNWANAVGKPVIMTEMGYQSADGCNENPNWVPPPLTQDLQEQADCYEAALQVFTAESWCKGIFWWGWEVSPLPSTDAHFSPRGKPAATVLANWYRGTNAGPVISAISATPSTIAAPGQVAFSVTAGDSEWDPLIYSWDFADGGTMNTDSGTHTFNSGGIYNVTVTVTDDHGGSAQSSATVTVTPVTPNQPPVISSQATATPTVATAGSSVSFSVAASDPDGDALNYNWNFADGGTMNTASGTHIFVNPGTYLVRVSINDGHGGSVQSSVSVTIVAPVISDPQPLGPPDDLDGDGFFNELEIAMGSSPLDAGSTPLGGAPAPAALAIGSPKFSVRLNFSRGFSDTLGLTGALQNVAEAQGVRKFAFGIGGVVRVVDISEKGRGENGDTRVMLQGRPRNGAQRFTIKVSHADLSNDLKDEGFISADMKNAMLSLDAWIWFDSKLYTQTLQAKYTARAGKTGSAR